MGPATNQVSQKSSERIIMKFHHINESEDDPFADPTPVDLTAYLAKLEAQLERYENGSIYFNGTGGEAANEIRNITGEPDSVLYCIGRSYLEPGWTRIGIYQISPAVLADPSLRYYVNQLKSEATAHLAWRDMNSKIKLIKHQIDITNDSLKGSS